MARSLWLFVLSLISSFQFPVHAASPAQNGVANWIGWSGNIYNNRWNSAGSSISVGGAAQMQQTCNITYDQGVSATPVLEGNIAYYPTWDGDFVALNYKTCQVVWNYNVTSLINSYAPQTMAQKKIVFQSARTSPVIDGNVIYFGTQPQFSTTTALAVRADGQQL